MSPASVAPSHSAFSLLHSSFPRRVAETSRAHNAFPSPFILRPSSLPPPYFRSMLKTHGLSHIALAVADPERSARFYSEAFGAKEYYRNENQIQVKGPGEWDVLAFDRDPARAGKL